MFVLTGHEVESSCSSTSQLCRRFTFSEIQLATQNLDESLVIGRGGFGKVYKGTITNGADLLTVAIKRLDSMSNQGASEFWAEINMLSNLRHCHLVSLIGYCNDEQEMILVYEYMPHGSLEDHFHKSQTVLSWMQRLRICIGVARGLDYLHTGTGIRHGVIHRDVKSSNILLHESWAAKISDFGLSKICPKDLQATYVNTLVKGTFGYLDPDYFYTGKLTRKSDVYAFGVVLFEVLCGKHAVDSSIDEEQWALAIWAQDCIKEGGVQSRTLRRFDYDTINVATENFSEVNRIPQLNTYDSLYKGKLQNGQDIAVCRIHCSSRFDFFMNEASLLEKLEHENLAKLLGYCYCIEGTRLCFVYDFALHTTLDQLMFDSACTLLNWDERYKIILGVARALLYLHRDAPIGIIHGDVKPESILLDENLNPILSGYMDIGYLHIYMTQHSQTTRSAVRRYVAPEYMFYGNLSTKTDVYNFGVLLLASITGDRDFTLDNVQKNWLEGTVSNIIDPRIVADSSSITRFLEIGLLCVQVDAEDRPMEEVVSMLLDSSSLTLPVSNMRVRMTGECSDDYDNTAVEEFLSDLCPR